VAALILVGVRPSEFERNDERSDARIVEDVQEDPSKIRRGDGVVVQLDGNLLIFTIAGRKIGKLKGQEWRRIEVAIEESPAEFLRMQIERNGGPIVIRMRSYQRLTRWVRDLSMELFPHTSTNDHVTAYTFRHRLASTLKSAGFSAQKIAAVLGQQSARTQEHYGRARLSKKKYSTIKSVDAANSVRITKEVDFNTLRKVKRLRKRRKP
jgi:integrase